MKIFFWVTIVPIIFISGFLSNELIYHSNILCGDESPARVNRELVYKDVTIHKGAVIPLKMCEYSTSFSIAFDLPHRLVFDDPENPLAKDDIEFLESSDVEKADYAGFINDFVAWQ